MLRYSLLHTLLGLLALSSCTSQYDIAGNSSLAEVDGHMIYLRALGGDESRMGHQIDSCRVVHGRFRFGGEIDSVVMAQMCLGYDMMMPIVIENTPLQVSIEAKGQTVEGGLLNKRLYTFLQKRDRLENELWMAEQECIRALRLGQGNIADVHERLRVRAEKLNKQIEEAETRFVEDNYTNALGPGYYIILCNQQFIPVMTEQLQRIADKAPDEFLAHPFIHNYLHMAGYDFNTPRQRRAKR